MQKMIYVILSVCNTSAHVQTAQSIGVSLLTQIMDSFDVTADPSL